MWCGRGRSEKGRSAEHGDSSHAQLNNKQMCDGAAQEVCLESNAYTCVPRKDLVLARTLLSESTQVEYRPPALPFYRIARPIAGKGLRHEQREGDRGLAIYLPPHTACRLVSLLRIVVDRAQN
jgi:hypothetical protein